MTDKMPFSLLKPSVDTPFHIDFDWWKEHEHDWHIHLQNCLCEEHQEYLGNENFNGDIDWIHPETAEVQSVDAVQHMLIEHCSKQPDFITPYTTLVESIFRTFLANGNAAMSATELELQTGKPAKTILRTLAGHKVYMGIRPFQG